jgi:IS605 OrfB family transposase
MNKTVACKLTPTPDQQAALLETLDLFAGACNAALKVAQETGKQLAYDIHHVCYCDIKESAGLTSNYVIRAIARVAASFGKKNPPDQADVNHCISRRIVEEAKATNKAIVLEDLSGIRKRGNDKSRRMRRMLGRWAFYQLRAFIEYKAKEAGVEVIIISPAYTSKTCSACGLIGHRRKHLFKCSCGFSCDADVNAAHNIAAQRALVVGIADAVNRPEAAVLVTDQQAA